MIQYCEALLANPQPFIDAMVYEVKSRGLTGVNLDLEPVCALRHGIFANSLSMKRFVLRGHAEREFGQDMGVTNEGPRSDSFRDCTHFMRIHY